MQQPHIHTSMMQDCCISYREWDFLRKSLRSTRINKKAKPRGSCFLDLKYREWDLNPHSHHWPKDFHTFVADHSTTAWTMS